MRQVVAELTQDEYTTLMAVLQGCNDPSYEGNDHMVSAMGKLRGTIKNGLGLHFVKTAVSTSPAFMRFSDALKYADTLDPERHWWIECAQFSQVGDPWTVRENEGTR